jgi:hypothetical protein
MYLIVTDRPSDNFNAPQRMRDGIMFGYLPKKMEAWDIHAVCQSYEMAKYVAHFIADLLHRPVEIRSGNIDTGEHFKMMTVDPKAPESPDKGDLDPYDGVPADTGSV